MSKDSTPQVVVSNEITTNELDNLKQIDCQVGGSCDVSNCNCADACSLLNAKGESSPTTGTKTKRKARSTRRRLNAMINNTSLHFSDTDSEGELSVPRVSIPNHHAKSPLNLSSNDNLLHPTISVTLDGSDDSSYGGGERRNSYLENLTDVDEIYTSEPEVNDERQGPRSPRGSLTVAENSHQGDTEFEDMSNDEEDVVVTIYVKPRSDILCDFNGETITTKEGDGPFSIEVRNHMSIDETKVISKTPEIEVMLSTDSEDMEASEDEEVEEGACGQRDSLEDFDILAASQIVMKNVNKMEQLLCVPDDHDPISDSHTDVEDVE